jgi:hypothetical protein
MTKYSQYQRTPSQKPETHPIWRGIGCALMVILPLLSFFGAEYLLELNQTLGWDFPIPEEFRGPPQYPYLFAKLTLGVLLLIASFAIVSVIFSLMNTLSGRNKRSPLDAPPPRRRPKRRR